MDDVSQDFVTECLQLAMKYKQTQQEASARFQREHQKLQLDEVFAPVNLVSIDARKESFDKLHKLRHFIDLLRSFNESNSSAFIAEVSSLAYALPGSTQEEIDVELREKAKVNAARYELQYEAKLIFAERAERLLNFFEDCGDRCVLEDGFVAFESDEDFAAWERLAESVDEAVERERATSVLNEAVSAMAGASFLEKMRRR